MGWFGDFESHVGANVISTYSPGIEFLGRPPSISIGTFFSPEMLT